MMSCRDHLRVAQLLINKGKWPVGGDGAGNGNTRNSVNNAANASSSSSSDDDGDVNAGHTLETTMYYLNKTVVTNKTVLGTCLPCCKEPQPGTQVCCCPPPGCAIPPSCPPPPTPPPPPPSPGPVPPAAPFTEHDGFYCSTVGANATRYYDKDGLSLQKCEAQCLEDAGCFCFDFEHTQKKETCRLYRGHTTLQATAHGYNAYTRNAQLSRQER